MRIATLSLIAGATVLAACGNQGAAEAAGAGAEGPAKPGSYLVTLQDGSQGRIALRPDMTFTLSERSDGRVLREGTWRQDAGQFCLNDTAREREVCMDQTAVGTSGAFTLGARGQVVMQLEPEATGG